MSGQEAASLASSSFSNNAVQVTPVFPAANSPNTYQALTSPGAAVPTTNASALPAADPTAVLPEIVAANNVYYRLQGSVMLSRSSASTLLSMIANPKSFRSKYNQLPHRI